MADKFTIPKAPKVGFTASFVKNLKPDPDGKMYEVADVGPNRCLRVRVTSNSIKFYMTARWKRGASSATSRLIGTFSAEARTGYFTLAEARKKAAEWAALRKVGLDPREEEEAIAAAAAAAKIALTKSAFAIVTEDFLAREEAKAGDVPRRGVAG